MLAGQSQRLAGGSDNLQLRGGVKQRGHQARAAEDMLEIIEIQQQLLFAQIIAQLLLRVSGARELQPQRSGCGAGDARRITQRRQCDIHHAVGVARAELHAQLPYQAAFAVATGRDDGDQPLALLK